jgi:hypothetical protein
MPGVTDKDVQDMRLNEFIQLTATKRGMDAELKIVKDRLAELMPQIVDDFRTFGTTSLTREGVTVYLQRDMTVRSKGGDTAIVVDKLRRARLGELIGINWPRIKAWCKERCWNKDLDEWVPDEKKLPPSLREVVELSEFTRVGVRKKS